MKDNTKIRYKMEREKIKKGSKKDIDLKINVIKLNAINFI